MSLFLEDRDRIVIPRWRKFNNGRLPIDALPLSNTNSDDFSLDQERYLNKKIGEWKEKSSISTALEVVNSAYSLGRLDFAMEAAKFILQQQRVLSSQVDSILKAVVGDIQQTENDFDLSNAILTGSVFVDFTNLVQVQIASVRSRIIQYPYNPLLWIELSRLHSILGHYEKAKRCVIVALNLSKHSNRFIIRGASRFYFHIEEKDMALQIIHKSGMFKDDPWLLSSEIAYSASLGKSSRYIKTGSLLVDSQKFSNTDISDLAASLGTIEAKNGMTKHTRRLINKALLSPNENSLAQVEYLTRFTVNVNLDPWLNQINNAYEARAHENYYKQKYLDSLSEGCQWLLDQPFSRRASHFSSYVAAALVGDLDCAIRISKFSLAMNAGSFAVYNHLIYALARKNDSIQAKSFLPNLRDFTESKAHKIILSATEGLVEFRVGNFENGRLKYRESIHLAEIEKNEGFRLLATCNLIWEELNAKQISHEDAVKSLERLDLNKYVGPVRPEIAKIGEQILKGITKMPG